MLQKILHIMQPKKLCKVMINLANWYEDQAQHDGVKPASLMLSF
jgi:hypothetical protein